MGFCQSYRDYRFIRRSIMIARDSFVRGGRRRRKRRSRKRTNEERRSVYDSETRIIQLAGVLLSRTSVYGSDSKS